MQTPIIMLTLMTLPYVLVAMLSKVTGRDLATRTAAAVGLALLFTMTGAGHFAVTESMVRMLPAWVPERTSLVLLTGVVELVIAMAFLIPATRRLAGLAAASLLVLFFPANIYAAIHHVPMGGHAWGPIYLLVRAPLQAAILVWVYWFTIRRPDGAQPAPHPMGSLSS